MKNLNILIVEDEILIAETIKLYLEERGHKVISIAMSYDEAIEILNKVRPSLVLIDVRLYGERSGIDLANYLYSLEEKIPYVMVSSQYDATIIENATQAGAAGYITKPISKKTLWATIELAALKSKKETLDAPYIDLKVGTNTQRIKLHQIIYIKSDHVYVEIVCIDAQKYTCRYSLNEISSIIGESHFLRCNRSYIINTQKIQKYSTSKIWIHNDVISIGMKYKSDVLEFLSKRKMN